MIETPDPNTDNTAVLAKIVVRNAISSSRSNALKSTNAHRPKSTNVAKVIPPKRSDKNTLLNAPRLLRGESDLQITGIFRTRVAVSKPPMANEMNTDHGPNNPFVNGVDTRNAPPISPMDAFIIP